MQSQVVLIVDDRKELPIKYKKLIENNCMVNPVIVDNFNDAVLNINRLEPELIIVANATESNSKEFCTTIRKEYRHNRPVVIALSKSSHLDDKLALLDAGADDFLSEPIDQAEFCARIKAHLRRNKEELSDHITNIPGAQMTFKVLRRTLKSNAQWALMYIDIDHFKDYKEIYGELASNRMIQAFSAIIQSVVDCCDYVGQIEENDFAILTTALKAEGMANFLNSAFDSVSKKFYTEEDTKRGYLMMRGNNIPGHRTPLVSISTGIITNEHKSYNDYKETINAVKNVHQLAKAQPGSSCVSHRLKLSGSCSNACPNKKILIVENDAALAYLLTTTLDMQGYKTEAISNYNEVMIKIDTYSPDIVIIDAGIESNLQGLESCRQIKDRMDLSNLKVIMSTVIHDKEMVLNTGADLYLPKPYELVTLFNWIKKFFATTV